MMSRQSLVAARLFGILFVFVTATTNAAEPAPKATVSESHWVASWGAAQMVPDAKNELPAPMWRDASLRQIVHVSLGASQVRVRVSNAFGTEPLVVDGASLARALAPGRADVDPATIRPLRFGGRASVMIPAGAEYASDPVDLPHPAGADLAVSMHFGAEPARQTSHPGSRANSFVVHGDHVLDARWEQAEKVQHWYQLTDIEVLAAPSAHAVVVIGDSITDGYGTTTEGNDRWTDRLAERLRASGMGEIGVVNAGIGGGRMLRDGLGPNLAARFDRDVLARSGVSHAIVLIGVNDLGVLHRNGQDQPAARAQMLDDLRTAYRQVVERAHAHVICVIGGTITPYSGSGYYRPAAPNEADRQALNAWIRSPGVFDAVADFDALLRDPAAPDHLAKQYDNDGLHPSLAGYRAMADAVPLSALKGCDAGRVRAARQ
jgi:lysophospholipase L1-like esterase